jgi:hypothetical protein
MATAMALVTSEFRPAYFRLYPFGGVTGNQRALETTEANQEFIASQLDAAWAQRRE